MKRYLCPSCFVVTHCDDAVFKQYCKDHPDEDESAPLSQPKDWTAYLLSLPREKWSQNDKKFMAEWGYE
jgi:hypothetical protein